MNNSRDDQFTERHVECQSGLYRFIATLVPNRADAEELFQEASLTASSGSVTWCGNTTTATRRSSRLRKRKS